MARSQNQFMKNQKAMKKKKKREEKLNKKINKKDEETHGDLESMMAYVDENGNIVDKKDSEEEESENKD